LIRSAVEQAATPEELRNAHAALAEALVAEPDRAVWHRAAAASGPDEAVAEALEAAANRATLRGAGDVAVSAFERAAELTAEPNRRATRLYRAGDLARELGRSSEGVRLLRAALQIGLPPAENAMASFTLELADNTWSGSATIRDFARIARELVDSEEGKRALRALNTISVRAYWERLEDETRHEIAAISDEIAVPPDDHSRLYVLGLVDPLGRGKEVVEQIKGLSPVGRSDPEELFDVGVAASSVWAGNLGLPFLRAAASTARAQLAYGVWLRRHRRMTQSRTPLREAAETFDALGLLRYAERTRRELRASGERVRSRAPGGWAQLSPQELQIAQLAAEGLSNRQIGEQLYLSHRTVESHLYRLFPKLGVTSRAQLRDALDLALPAAMQ
jgi:DNA-binding CsgD family transcriptional regulator